MIVSSILVGYLYIKIFIIYDTWSAQLIKEVSPQCVSIGQNIRPHASEKSRNFK